jgi:HK97 family phage major capsid protein
MTLKLTDSASAKRALEHATRPHLSPTELLAQHARIERDKHADRAAAILRRPEKEARSANGAELGEVSAALAQHDEWDARYDRFTQQVSEQRTRLSIRREPLSYEPPEREGKYSYFADQYQARYLSSQGAKERLQRHVAEMAVEMPKVRERLLQEQRAQTDALGAEYRVTPSPTQTPNFSPPAYLIDDWVKLARPYRVLSAQFKNFTLPRGVQTINLPRLTTGTAAQVVQNAQATPETDIVDANSSAQVILIAGQQDVSLQLLEQSTASAHLDRVIWTDLTSAYDATVESQVWSGGGGSAEVNGVLNAGIGAVTTSEAIGVKTFPSLGELFGYVSDKRKISPTALFMRGGRWASIAVSEDEQKRPLYVPLDVQTSRTAQPIGVILGLPVYLTESVPVNLGTAKNQDCILAGRPEDSYFWESPPNLSLFDEILSSTLEARIVMRGYVAAIHRYPAAYCSLTGWKVEANL